VQAKVYHSVAVHKHNGYRHPFTKPSEKL